MDSKKLRVCFFIIITLIVSFPAYAELVILPSGKWEMTITYPDLKWKFELVLRD